MKNYKLKTDIQTLETLKDYFAEMEYKVGMSKDDKIAIGEILLLDALENLRTYFIEQYINAFKKQKIEVNLKFSRSEILVLHYLYKTVLHAKFTYVPVSFIQTLDTLKFQIESEIKAKL